MNYKEISPLCFRFYSGFYNCQCFDHSSSAASAKNNQYSNIISFAAHYLFLRFILTYISVCCELLQDKHSKTFKCNEGAAFQLNWLHSKNVSLKGINSLVWFVTLKITISHSLPLAHDPVCC